LDAVCDQRAVHLYDVILGVRVCPVIGRGPADGQGPRSESFSLAQESGGIDRGLFSRAGALQDIGVQPHRVFELLTEKAHEPTQG